MNIEISNQDPFVLVFHNLFSKDRNKKILEEAISLENQFSGGMVGGGTGKIDNKIRTNLVCMYDRIYPTQNDRSKSNLLKSIDIAFSDLKLLFTSCPQPICRFGATNYHESQVSRYGSEGQKYEWHVDSLGHLSRVMTFIYYFNKEPKKFSGGNLQISKSPIYRDKLIEKNPEIIDLKIENNMAVIFSSNIAHRVLATQSPDKFDEGRFSVNCWIGLT